MSLIKSHFLLSLILEQPKFHYTMGIVVVILALLYLTSLSHAGPGRVVNGSEALPNSLPYMVSLQDMLGQHICGGTILNENFILTAAHCEREFMDAVIGEHDLDYDSNEEQKIDAGEWIVHEEYFLDPVLVAVNDIALVKLAKPIELNEVAQKVTLPEADEEVVQGGRGTVSGWGFLLDDNGQLIPASILNFAELQVYTDEECLDHYEDSEYDVLPEVHLCAGGFGTSGCWVGDSGGPIVVDGKQMGIVSWGDTSDGTCYAYPTVFAKVSHYMEWIMDHMEK